MEKENNNTMNYLDLTYLENPQHKNITHRKTAMSTTIRRTIKTLQKKTKKNWITFTCLGKETRYTTKHLKNSNVQPAFRTVNTLKSHLHST
jgi:hypothetical protein